jgi:hypothetical protein
VAGVLAGSIVDRFDRRTLMIVCELVRALLYAVVPLVWVLDPQLWVLFVVMPLGAAAGMVYQVTYVTAIPALVGRERVTSAFWTLHFLPGPVGALLVTAAGQRYGVPAVALAVAVGLLLIAGAAAFSPIRARDPGLVPA